jgi:hypothetical protein
MLEQELDQLYNTIDGLLKAQEFEMINELLVNAPIGSLDQMLGYLTTTRCEKSKLPAYGGYYTKVKEYCLTTYGETETLELLKGLD